MCDNNIYVGKSQGQLFWRKFLAEKFSELTSCFSEKLNSKYKGVGSRPRQHTDYQYTDYPPTPQYPDYQYTDYSVAKKPQLPEQLWQFYH